MNNAEKHHQADTAFSEIFIENPRVQQAHALLERMCAKSANDQVREKPCVSLIGPSQAGKTTTIRAFADRKNTPDLFEAGKVPVLYVIIGSSITRKGLLQDILLVMENLGFVTLPKSGTESILLDRVCTYLRALGVQLLVIDECHHLKRGTDGRYASDVGEMLKSILLRGACAVVMAGVDEDAEAPFIHNEQLALRAFPRIDFSPLRPEIPEEHEIFQDFVVDLLMELSDRELIDNAEALASKETLFALHQTSQGSIGRVCRIFQYAVEHMIDRNDQGLSIEDLTYAADVLQQHKPGKVRNAFRDLSC